MIKKYKLFKESLLDKLQGPTEEEIRNHLNGVKDIDQKLNIAIKNNIIDVIEDIVNNNSYGEERALRDVLYYNNTTLVYYFLDKNETFNIINKNALNLVLIYSSEYGNFELVKFAIEKGADVNSGRSYSLRYAILNNHLEIAKYLIENGADIEQANFFLIKYKKFDESKLLYSLKNV